MTTRERIAKRIQDWDKMHDTTGNPLTQLGAEMLADAVLDELGWDDAPIRTAKETGDLYQAEHIPPGTYRLIREVDPE